jgi:hypothetical protein
MITLLAATIVVALIALGAYIHVANERDYLAIEVANLEHRLKPSEDANNGEDS